jgi:2-haloacid dehalogenase
MPLLDFSSIELLSFDCYGTMIDWETGILGALRPILHHHNVVLDDATLLRHYGEIEHTEQEGEFKPYREVLTALVRRMGERLGFIPSAVEAGSLADSLGRWPPFPDTTAALERLQTRFRLAVISNTDDELFAQTAPHLKVRFADVITAQQARAYKPSPRIFEMAASRLRVPRERWLHVGQSMYHDVAPAQAMQLATALVYRRGSGATPPTKAEPDLAVPDLQTLASRAFERIQTLS